MQTLNNIRWLDLDRRDDHLSPRIAAAVIVTVAAASWGAVVAIVFALV